MAYRSQELKEEEEEGAAVVEMVDTEGHEVEMEMEDQVVVAAAAGAAAAAAAMLITGHRVAAGANVHAWAAEVAPQAVPRETLWR